VLIVGWSLRPRLRHPGFRTKAAHSQRVPVVDRRRVGRRVVSYRDTRLISPGLRRRGGILREQPPGTPSAV